MQRPAKVAWWEPAARWSRLVVATSVAAGIALIMVVRASPKEATDAIDRDRCHGYRSA